MTRTTQTRLAARCEAAWAAEVERRVGELEAAKAKLIPWARVRRRLEAAVVHGGAAGGARSPLRRSAGQRLARECVKLDPREEKALAEEGLDGGAETWPEY